MQPYASFKILAADIAAMSAGVSNWVDSRGKLSSAANRVTQSYNFETSQLVKIYYSYVAMTGGTGGRFDLSELWPQQPSPAPNIDSATNPAGRGGVQIITLTTDAPVAPAASNILLNLAQYGAFRSSANNFPVIWYRGGSIGLQLFFTTLPTTTQDIYVEIWGIKDATFPRH